MNGVSRAQRVSVYGVLKQRGNGGAKYPIFQIAIPWRSGSWHFYHFFKFADFCRWFQTVRGWWWQNGRGSAQTKGHQEEVDGNWKEGIGKRQRALDSQGMGVEVARSEGMSADARI